MAKQTASDGIALTLFKDAVTPKPDQKGTWGNMGDVFTEEGRAETKGEISGVQFLKTEGTGTKKPFGK